MAKARGMGCAYRGGGIVGKGAGTPTTMVSNYERTATPKKKKRVAIKDKVGNVPSTQDQMGLTSMGGPGAMPMMKKGGKVKKR